MNFARLIPLIDARNRSLFARAVRGVLSCAEPVYRLAVNRRNRAFDTDKRAAVPLGRPTLSVGNLTTGGTGKTPTVIDLARRLHDMGKRPGVLLRGYHTEDEAVELREALGDIADVQVNPDRAAGAVQLLARSPQTQVLLLDDGFQHRQAQRDLDLVLIDAMRPFGFDHLLPRGLLREPMANLKRAGAVIVTRCDRVGEEVLHELDNTIADLTGQTPLAHTAHRWTALQDSQQTRAIEDLSAMRVVGVCGIANPDAFEQTLKQHAGRVQGFASFEDHHIYTQSELQSIFDQAKRDFADAIVTTEKDYVKWRPLLQTMTPSITLLRPKLQMVYLHGEAALEALLRKTVEA